MIINKIENIRRFSLASICARFTCVTICLLALPLLVIIPASPVQAQSPELTKWYCPYCKSWYAMNASCPHISGGKSRGGGSSAHSHKSSKPSTKHAIVGAFGEVLERTLNDKTDLAKQAAELKRQQEAAALAAQQEAALAAQQQAAKDELASQSWNKEQWEAHREKAANLAKGKGLLQKMDSSNGSAAQLAPLGPGAFQWDKPRTDLPLMKAGSVPAPDRAMGQLQAAAGFSHAAASAGNVDQAQMLAGQAGLVMPGGTTALQAPLLQLPVVPPASPPMRVEAKEQMELNIKRNSQKLQGLEAKREEIKSREKTITTQREEAKNMADQAKQLRESTQPQDKRNADDLERAAKELEESVKQQLDEVNHDTKTLDDQIGQTKNALEQDNAALQRLEIENRDGQKGTGSSNAQ